MSRFSYSAPPPAEASVELGAKLVRVIVDSGVTYRQAAEALAVAEEVLAVSTHPVISESTAPED